ncbi:MAG: type II secretion system protein GspK [Myxococcales bacterium]|nr:type II secretion system protein GspK [Myxococcales bacterium]
MALVMVLAVVAILTIFVADLMQNTSTAFHVTVSARDRLRAEYAAKSGLNLTRLLIAREPDIRKAVGGLYQMLVRRAPPQLNVWDFADLILAPFADPENAKAMGQESGIDFSMMEGVEDTKAIFEVVAVPENAKINLNDPLFFTGDDAKLSTARQFFALMGGLQSPDSPYDPMFATRDPDGHFTTRLDVVSAMIDWWDPDQTRTIFDPGGHGAIAAAGSEDDIYSQFPDPYEVKNAPFDSLEELRLIRGVGDDFWATFIEDNPDDPRSRKITIYGSGAVNVNLAPPEVLLARLCSFVNDQPLCLDPTQASAFIQLFRTARAIIPVALFSTPKDFIDFVSGRSNKGTDIYAMLMGFLGPENPLMMWTPLQIPQAQEQQVTGKFLTAASIFTIQSVGRSGRAQAKMTAVVNFDKPWTPPPGVPGRLPPLGVFHHYRME